MSMLSLRRIGAALAPASLALSLAFAAPASAHDYQAGALKIDHPWSRATPPGASVGVGYLSIENTGTADDRLLSIKGAISPDIEMHESAEKDGVATMRPVKDGIVVPAGKTVELAPGGYHLMLKKLAEPLKEGESVPVTLTFEKAGSIDVDLTVTAMGAPGPGHDNHEGHGDMEMDHMAPIKH
jgi:copper(I)-binding protein